MRRETPTNRPREVRRVGAPADTPRLPADPLEFADLELDRRAGELRRCGAPIHLAPLTWRLLLLLLDRAGELVSRDELREALWGEGTGGDHEVALNHCVTRLRRALGDDLGQPRFVLTVPRRGYRFVATVRRPLGAGPRSLAVIPFENLNGRFEDEYLADSMTEVLLNELGRRRSIRVVPRQSVLHLKGSTLPLRELARELAADALLQGALLRCEGHLRVTSELVAVSPERHLWAGSQEGELSDLFGFFGRASHCIADSVVRAMRGPALELEAADALGSLGPA